MKKRYWFAAYWLLGTVLLVSPPGYAASPGAESNILSSCVPTVSKDLEVTISSECSYVIVEQVSLQIESGMDWFSALVFGDNSFDASRKGTVTISSDID